MKRMDASRWHGAIPCHRVLSSTVFLVVGGPLSSLAVPVAVGGLSRRPRSSRGSSFLTPTQVDRDRRRQRAAPGPSGAQTDLSSVGARSPAGFSPSGQGLESVDG